ncbi:DMSO/TMAO reductase YedYZ molybdopterin-dependent catalytic subunit [Microlunatus panaciterrae]|uniref:DMSO/TMAO reductase YedYZ molybdopterin-dependent catalytic subunit n=1 Tax=Microlunatus panaciterrae TaxID=400768 RepID=A0ABS2RIH2_9ACTN|nr:DMSO/TMAO reductase YedYZ molybdopterin-dependent catalytic subunit [Microlunatus panaciterrae]
MTENQPAAAPRPEPVPGGWARLSGVIGGMAGLAVADLVAWFLSPPGSPLSAVGELIISVLPASMIEFGKTTLGRADKPILLGIIALAVLLICALAGQLEYRHRYRGAAVFGLLAAVALVAVTLTPDKSPLSFLPAVVGLAAGYGILRLLLTRLQRWHPQRAAGPTDAERAPVPGRRNFIGLAIVIGAASVVAAVGSRALAGAANAVSSARDRLKLPAAASPAPPVPAGADFGGSGLTSYVTPNQDFYRIDTALQVPVVDPDSWKLTITGMVQNPVEITFAELLAKPLVEHMVTLTCVSNEVGGELAGNALWLGFPVRELLAEARPDPAADMVLSRSVDGWTAGTPLEVLTDQNRQCLLAVGMNGEPLPIEHGFPVRMVVPGLYGYVSATKWVTELKVTTFKQDMGYWTPLGWSARGPIKLQSRIDTPRKSTIKAGRIVFAGVAWAQHTGIRGVEVRLDAGPWQQADLAETVGPDTWRQWRLEWQSAPGYHTVTVRAIDQNGTVQTDVKAPPDPDGATGLHAITFIVEE